MLKMTIIDQYIADHRHEKTNSEIAQVIGVTEAFIIARRNNMEKPLPTILLTAEDELYALVQFILKRKTGCLVDIAQQRIKDISEALNK